MYNVVLCYFIREKARDDRDEDGAIMVMERVHIFHPFSLSSSCPNFLTNNGINININQTMAKISLLCLILCTYVCTYPQTVLLLKDLQTCYVTNINMDENANVNVNVCEIDSGCITLTIFSHYGFSVYECICVGFSYKFIDIVLCSFI